MDLQDKFKDDDGKVRGHFNFTGKCPGAAHNKCNLKFEKLEFTPIIFHKLAEYDSHLFKNLAKSEGNIKCTSNNEEKYISFSKDMLFDMCTTKEGKLVTV